LGSFCGEKRLFCEQKSTKNAKNRSGFSGDLLILIGLEPFFIKIGVIFSLFNFALPSRGRNPEFKSGDLAPLACAIGAPVSLLNASTSIMEQVCAGSGK
jgi:hypothetical protein